MTDSQWLLYAVSETRYQKGSKTEPNTLCNCALGSEETRPGIEVGAGRFINGKRQPWRFLRQKKEGTAQDRASNSLEASSLHLKAAKVGTFHGA